MENLLNTDNIDDIINSLYKSIKIDDFKGYNPYDLLASNTFIKKIKNINLLQLLIQLNKLSPINFRKFLKINKHVNPKAIALLLIANSNYNFLHENDKSKLTKILIAAKCVKYNEYTAGFPFPIILSHYISEANEPSLIISLFAMYAFLSIDEEEVTEFLNPFENLINEKLPQIDTSDVLKYSYNFSKFNEVYNATAKIGKFFALQFLRNKDAKYILKIEKILNYLAINQRSDGSWPYAKNMVYSDGFHTAFIIEAIYYMLKVVTKKSFISMQEKALSNYYCSFFLDNYQPIYYHPQYKPMFPKKYFPETDIRDCSMALIISKLYKNDEFLKGVYNWTIDNMYCRKKGYAYFYKEKIWTNKIKYIRAQAWLIYALTILRKKL